MKPLPLNEIDYFMVAMDRLFRRRSTRGNCCYLALSLPRRASQSEIQERLDVSPLWRELSRLRLTSSFLGYPRWRFCDQPSAKVEVQELEVNERESFISSLDIDPRRQAPLEAKLLLHPTSSTLLLGWHHALLDAHRAEALFAELFETKPASRGEISPPSRRPTPPLPLAAQLPLANQARRSILQASKAPILSPLGLPPRDIRARYARISFSSEETNRIDLAIRQGGFELFPSCLILAAVIRALLRVQFLPQPPQRGSAEDADLLIPVPHDARRGKSVARHASNDLTFFFFRVKQSACSELPKLAAALLQQAQEFVGAGFLKGVPLFLKFASALPLSPYLKLLASASVGHFASFYFSDVGSSLDLFEHFGPSEIVEARHFPPLFIPPGMSVVASRRRGALALDFVFGEGVLNSSQIEEISLQLRKDLLIA